MKIKHFVITRFLCSNFRGISDCELLNNKNLELHYNLLNAHLLKSLEAQTTTDFELIILIHENLNIYNKQMFDNVYELKSSFPIKVMFLSELKNYIYNFYNTYDFIITSRIDLDDFIAHNAIEKLHNYCKCVDNFCLYGFADGCTLYYNETKKENEIYYMPQRYKDVGFLAILMSLIINTKSIKTPYTIFDMGDHTKCISNIKNNPSVIGLNKTPAYQFWHYEYFAKDKEYTYLYYMHRNSDSVKAGRTITRFSEQSINNNIISQFI
jgi:hypothetical protein